MVKIGKFGRCFSCETCACATTSVCDKKTKFPLLPMMFLAAIVASVAAVTYLPLLVAGIVCGANATAIAMWILMPKMMIVRHRSRYGLDETIERLKAAIESAGWHVPAVRDLNKSMAAQGVEFERPVRLIELCKAEYAGAVLAGDRYLSTLMPCAFGVYEDDNGQVHISGMNTGLMGKMFGGSVAEIMGGYVAADEREILRSVIKR